MPPSTRPWPGAPAHRQRRRASARTPGSSPGSRRHGQAAPRERPAPRGRHPRDLVPGRSALHGRCRGAALSTWLGVLVQWPARRHHRPQPVHRLGVHQPRSGRHRLLPRARRRRHLPARRASGYPLQTRQETIDVRGGARRDDHRPQHRSTARCCPTSSPRGRCWVERTDRQQGGQRRAAYAVSLAWTGLIPNKTADAILAHQHGARTSPSSARPPGPSPCRPRTSSTPTRQATSDTRRRGSIPIRKAAHPTPSRATGPLPDGTRPTTGRVSSRSTRCPGPTTPRRGSSSRRTRRSPRPARRSSRPSGPTASGPSGSATCSAVATAGHPGRHGVDPDGHQEPCRRDPRPGAALGVDSPRATRRRGRIHQGRPEPAARVGRHPTGSHGSASAAARPTTTPSGTTCSACLRRRASRRPPGQRQRSVDGGRHKLLDNPKSPWWDNKQTPDITEGRDEILRQAMVTARLELTKALGKDPTAGSGASSTS